MSTLLTGEYATPFGVLAVVVSAEDGVVRGSGFRSLNEVIRLLPRGLQGRRLESAEVPAVADAVAAWLAGDGSLLGEVPAQQEGGPFTQAAWAALREVPSGAVVSYQELAEMAGSPLAMRAAGQACAQNRLAPFVPCHRVINTGGKLGAYGFGGPAMKAQMLALEGATGFLAQVSR